jgi:manganese/zinc/iron transport system ATP- binding protein
MRKQKRLEGTAVAVSELTVNHGRTPCLWDLSFEVPAGKLVAIIGPNGAGKSTLLKTGLGIHRPLAGAVHFFGRPYGQVRRRIAYVPQKESVDWDFPVTVLDLVLMGCYGRVGRFRWPSRKERTRALEALELVGMEGFAGRQIGQLSGGQQQRAFLARALVQDADLFLMDEPFAGVDAATEQAIFELMKGLRDEGKSIFVVQHDLGTVRERFDWVVMLNMRLVANGPVDKVFTEENLAAAYGKESVLFGEAVKLSQTKTSGLA